VFTSAEAEQLTLKGRSFGRDVIVQVGYWRFWQHATLDEILERCQQRKIAISRREILNLLGDFLALLRAAQPAKIAAQRGFFEQQGLILGLDGLQPEKGNDCLYIMREEQTGVVLVAETLATSSIQALDEQVLQPLASLGFRVRGIISDAQDEIQKAVERRFPGVPHHTCHFHCLREAGKPTFEADRALKTDLKQALRPKLSGLSRRLKRLPLEDRCRLVLANYVTCLRSTLLVDGVAPFDLGGLQVCDDLQTVEDSLQRCREKGGTSSWTGCWLSSLFIAALRTPMLGSSVNSAG
jgi:hypothetical protein